MVLVCVRLQRVQTSRIILSLVNAEPHFVIHQQADFVKHIQAQVSAIVPTHTTGPEIRAYQQKDVEDFLVADCKFKFKRACRQKKF